MSVYTKLFIIRHGDTVDEETKKIYKGTLDVPLSQKGIKRIENVARFLSNSTLDVIYTSALSRCIASGSIIALPHDLHVQIETGLNEVGFGEWEGLSFNEIRSSYPQLFDMWLRDPVQYTPPGGEPLLRARDRIMKTFYEIIERQRGSTIAVVCHAGVIKIILATLLSMDLCRIHSLAQDYGCVNIVEIYEDNNALIRLLNFSTTMDYSGNSG